MQQRKLLNQPLACAMAINVLHAFNDWRINSIFFFQCLIKRWRVTSFKLLFFYLNGQPCWWLLFGNAFIKYVYRARKRFIPISWHTNWLKVAASIKRNWWKFSHKRYLCLIDAKFTRFGRWFCLKLIEMPTSMTCKTKFDQSQLANLIKKSPIESRSSPSDV